MCEGNNRDKGCDGVCFSKKKKDCAGQCGGKSGVDDCGVCGGNNKDRGCDGLCFSGMKVDCNGVCGGPVKPDDCGVCGGTNQDKGCDGVCFSKKKPDCNGVCGGAAVVDTCGVCGGNNRDMGPDGRCFSAASCAAPPPPSCGGGCNTCGGGCPAPSVGTITREEYGPSWIVQVLLRVLFITLLGSAVGTAVIRVMLGRRLVADDAMTLSYIKESEDPATYNARLWNARRRCVRMLCVTAASQARYPNSDRPKAALAALVRLASPNSRGSNYLVFVCGGLEAAMVMMAVNRSNPQVLTNVCTLLHELASAPPTVVKVRHTPNVANSKIPLAVLTVMRLFPSEPRVVEAAAAALWSFAFGSGAFIQTTLVAADAHLDLMSAIVRYGEDIPVLYRACGAIMALALRNSETQKIMGEAGAAHLLMETLTSHRELNYGGDFSELRIWMRKYSSETPKKLTGAKKERRDLWEIVRDQG